MSEYLVVRLMEAGSEAAWVALDGDGHRLAQAESGSLEEAAAQTDGRRVMLLVDGLQVITTTANLPAKGPARLLKMLPYALEDVVVEEVEKFLFCPGPRNDDGAVAVAIVEREKLDAWLTRCEEAGLAANFVYADTEGVPDTPGNLTLVVEGERVYGRPPGCPAFVLEDFGLGDVLQLLSPADEDDPGSRHVLIYADETGYAGREAEIDALREQVASLDLQVLPEGPLPRFGATLINDPGSNLRQGAYAPKSNWGNLVRPWRLAAALLLSLGILATLTEGARYYALSQENQALTARLETDCRNSFQSTQISACRSEIQRRLSSAGATSAAIAGPLFLETLVAVAEARDSTSRIEALSFRNGVTDLRVVAPDVPTLDGLAREMASSGRFQVNIQSANPGTDGVEGRLQVMEADR